MNQVKSEELTPYAIGKAAPKNLIAQADADTIKLAIDIITRVLSTKNYRDEQGTFTFTRPVLTKSFCKLQIGLEERELFGILFLDNRNTLITYETLFMGTIDGASVHIREIIKAALRHNAAALILTHNHPSGNSTPSKADEVITKRIQEAAKLMEIRVLDHIVVGINIFSFAENGLM